MAVVALPADRRHDETMTAFHQLAWRLRHDELARHLLELVEQIPERHWSVLEESVRTLLKQALGRAAVRA